MNDSPVSVDTSIAVPLLVAAHQHHQAVAAWASGWELRLSGHALAETYSVLTRLPGSSRVAPADAVVLIEDNFGDTLALSADGRFGLAPAVDSGQQLVEHVEGHPLVLVVGMGDVA